MEKASRELGELLRRAREARGLTVQQVAAETKLPLRHLLALESGNLMGLPGRFYRRAEVRAYAQAVHLDAAVALEQLERALDIETPDTPASKPEAGPERTTPWPRYALAAVGVVAVALVLGVAHQKRRPTVTARLDRSVETPETSHDREAAASTVADAVDVAPPANVSVVPTPAPTTEGTSGTEDRQSGSSTQESGLAITSDPPGARVTVDGVGWGKTPVTIRYLASGTKRIRVSMVGFLSEERDASIPSRGLGT